MRGRHSRRTTPWTSKASAPSWQLPRLTVCPFRYTTHADRYLEVALRYAHVPVKQAVIAASCLSLLYPADGIDGYPRAAFLADLVREAAADIRGALDKGAHSVQIDFTEGRLAVKLDPTGQLLPSFVELNNRVLAGFTARERRRIGVHTCPGGDKDSTYGADVDYAGLLPSPLDLNVGTVYLQLASEPDRPRVLRLIAGHAKPDQRIFVGVIDPIDPRVETAEEVGTGSWRPPGTSSRVGWALVMTAVSPRSARTRQPPARPRSRRSAPGWPAPR